GRIRHRMRWNEDGDLPILQAADADASLPAWMHALGGFGVRGVNHIARVDGQPARAPKLGIRGDELPFLGQNLDAMVVPIGHHETTLRVELDGVRRSEFSRPGAGLADHAQELSGPIEHRDASDQIGIRDVGMALRDVDIAVAWIGHDVGWIGQRLRRITADTWLAQRQQDFAVGAELHDDTALAFGATRIGDPHIPIAIDMNAMRPDEQPAAEATNLATAFVEVVHRVHRAAETARRRAR